MNQDELLAHAGFVHALARSLVRDEHHAADVEQRTWLAALEHPPANEKNVRSWLSRVIKNFVITMYRGETRRMKYENALEQPESITSPEEISIRKEALRKMSEAVFNLEEPYFSTILLRYYEDLPAAKVAERLGVPLETVKTRLQRALKILKKHLDEQSNGNRKEWCLALAAVAGINVTAATSVSAAAITGSSLTPSFAAIYVKLKLCLLAALFVGTSLTLFHFFAGTSLDTMDSDLNPLAATGNESDSTVISRITTDSRPDASPDGDREALPPTQPFIAGKVTDLKTGNPITAFDIKIKSNNDASERKMPVHETLYDEEGLFSIALPMAGTYDLEVCSSCYNKNRISRLSVPEKTGISDLQIKLDPGYTLSGIVIDDATDKPISGALVGPADYLQETDLVSIELLNYKEDGVHTYTNPEGRFTLKGLVEDYKIAAMHPDYAEGSIMVKPGSSHDAEIRLKRGFHIYGKACDDQGNPAEGVLIHMISEDSPTLRPTVTGQDGSFRTAPTLPGRIVMKAGEPDWEFKGHPNFSEEYKIVEVIDKDVKIHFGPSPDLVTLTGTLYDFNGAPKPDGAFQLCSGDHSPWTAQWYRLVRPVKCDNEGKFKVDKLTPGRYRVNFHPHGQSPFEWGVLALEESGPVERDINLSQNASCAGMVINAVTGMACTNVKGEVWARKSVGGDRPFYKYLDSNGAFEIRGLTPGSYTIQAKVNDIFTRKLLGINIGRGENIKDLKLLLAPSGKLKMRLEGFDESKQAPFNLYLSGGENIQHHHFNYRIAETGNHEKTFPLEIGLWKLAISFSEFGFLQSDFEVFENHETEIVIHKNDLYIRPSMLSVQGEVRYPDSLPVKDLALVFHASSVPGLDENQKELHTCTQPDGSFRLQGLKPGQWRVKARLNDTAWIDFPEIWIAPDAADPFTCPLTFHRGMVTGSLFNGLEQRPISDDTSWRWRAYLYNVKEDRNTGGFECASSDSNTFLILGAAAGNYQLIVKAEGYEDFESGAFSLDEGDSIDLGEIMLNPCGVLNLEVVDEYFLAIPSYTLSCEGHRKSYERSLQGIRRYDNLPVGMTTIIINAKGYETQRVKVQLEPASPVDARVVMPRE
ncbi:MAG: sigma-70 family RNA polymerase sigma factor [Planctomycetota bacterium]